MAQRFGLSQDNPYDDSAAMDFTFKSPWERMVSHRRSRSDSASTAKEILYGTDDDATAAQINQRTRAQSWLPPTRKKHAMSQLVFHPSDHTEHMSSSPMAPPPLDVPRTSYSSGESAESLSYRDSSSSTSTRHTSLCGSGGASTTWSENQDPRLPTMPPKRPPRPEHGLFDDDPAIASSRLNAWNSPSQTGAASDEVRDLLQETYRAYDAADDTTVAYKSPGQQTKANPTTPSRESSLSRRAQPRSFFDTSDKPLRRKSSRTRPAKKFGRRSVQLPARMMPKPIRWSLLTHLLQPKRNSAQDMLEPKYLDTMTTNHGKLPQPFAAPDSQTDQDLSNAFHTQCTIGQSADTPMQPDGRATPTPPLPPKNPARLGRSHIANLPTIPESLITSLENDLRRRGSIRSFRLSRNGSLAERRVSQYLRGAQLSMAHGPPSRRASVHHHSPVSSHDDASSDWSDYNTPSTASPDTPCIPGLPAPEEYEDEVPDDMAEWFDEFGFESHGRLIDAASPSSRRRSQNQGHGHSATRSLNSVHSMDSSTSTLEDPDSPVPNKAEVVMPQSLEQMNANPASYKYHLSTLTRLQVPGSSAHVPHYELPMDPEVKEPSPAPRMSCNLSEDLDSFLAWNPTPVADETFYEE
ncbi:hypothetical protein K4F52_004058 [Lecanicillium sp. MT-2017a]|nr:hypothetical protein K4F52_004058 [Lecanicillium sp. MT-2017a]